MAYYKQHCPIPGVAPPAVPADQKPAPPPKKVWCAHPHRSCWASPSTGAPEGLGGSSFGVYNAVLKELRYRTSYMCCGCCCCLQRCCRGCCRCCRCCCCCRSCGCSWALVPVWRSLDVWTQWAEQLLFVVFQHIKTHLGLVWYVCFCGRSPKVEQLEIHRKERPTDFHMSSGTEVAPRSPTFVFLDAPSAFLGSVAQTLEGLVRADSAADWNPAAVGVTRLM